MKLIIDIDKELYNEIKKDKYRLYTAKSCETMLDSIVEDIKAEIQKEENIWYHDCEADFSKKFDVIRVDTVLDILDKHIKKNSCNTCTHKGYDCDNDFWINCEQYDREINNDNTYRQTN